MPEPVSYERARDLASQGGQVVEVLPGDEYREQHLPGAINIPLKELDAAAVAGLDRTAPVIVYCWDSI